MFRRRRKIKKLKSRGSRSYWIADVFDVVEEFFDAVLDWW